MPLYGVDISNHNVGLDLAKVREEGFAFVFAKVSEGSGYRDPLWPGYRDQARANSLFLAGYHYVRADSDPAAQAKTLVEHLGDVSIPVMLDVEANSGNIDVYWDVLRAVEELGANVRLSYLPHWYWEQISSPDLSAVPGLFASHYATSQHIYASTIYGDVPSSFWLGYGNKRPDLLQFTNKALVDGHLVDASFFPGKLDAFAELLGVDVPSPAPVEFSIPLGSGLAPPSGVPLGPVRLAPEQQEPPPGLGHQDGEQADQS